MPSDSEGLWPRLPDAAEPLDEEEPVAGDTPSGIDADERIIADDDDVER